MNIEEMNVEQLQEYRNNLKIEYYDNERRNDEIVQIVENVNNRIKELNSKNETSIIETPVEETKEEVQETNEAIPQVEIPEETKEEIQETSEVIPQVEIPEENKEEVQESNEVIPQVEIPKETKEEVVEVPQASDTVEVSQEVQVNDEIKGEDVTPLIPAIELPQASDNVEVTQEAQVATDVAPLIPTVDIPQSPVEEVKLVENAVTYKKTDSGTSKAIIVNSAQLSKLAASKEANKDLVFGKEEVTDTAQEEMKQMMEQAQQLYAEGKTAEAEQMTAKILSKNNSEAA